VAHLYTIIKKIDKINTENS